MSSMKNSRFDNEWYLYVLVLGRLFYKMKQKTFHFNFSFSQTSTRVYMYEDDLQLGKLKENCLLLKFYRRLGKMFLSPRRESNPQPSDLRWDALTIELPGLRWQREGHDMYRFVSIVCALALLPVSAVSHVETKRRAIKKTERGTQKVATLLATLFELWPFGEFGIGL